MEVQLKYWLAAIACVGIGGVAYSASPQARTVSHVNYAEKETADQKATTLAPTACSAIDPCACSSACDDACHGCDSIGSCDSSCGCNGGLLGFGLIKRSDHCFDDFISPMTNPVFFEDPRTLTEARLIFINHQLPVALGDHSAQVLAMQVRAAITDRLSIIATKDGYIFSQSPIVNDGAADITAGLKYNLLRDTCTGTLFSVGTTFEAPAGAVRSLQGNGNGEFHFFGTGGMRLGDSSHWISGSGIRIPVDDTLENRVWYWSNHFDREVVADRVYAFTEINWYNWLSSGTAFPLPVEGGDLFNLGSVGVTGNDIVTQAIGTKFKPSGNIETGVAWEFPLTERRGVLDDRLTVDLIIRY